MTTNPTGPTSVRFTHRLLSVAEFSDGTRGFKLEQVPETVMLTRHTGLARYIDVPAAAAGEVDEYQAACDRLIDELRPTIGDTRWLKLSDAVNNLVSAIRDEAMCRLVAAAVALSRSPETGVYILPGHDAPDSDILETVPEPPAP